MKKYIAGLLCCTLIMGMILTSCGGTEETKEGTQAESLSETETETQKETEPETTVPETTVEETLMYPESADGVYQMGSLEGWIKLHGRQYFTKEGVLTCDWSGAGFTMNVKSEGETAKVAVTNSYGVYFSVHVNGEEIARPLIETEGEIEIVLPAGESKISVYKETEVNPDVGQHCEMVSFTFAGEILPADKDKDLLIEVCGDSISCGDGAIGVYTAGQAWKKEDHSYTHSFTYYIGQKLDCDMQLCGKGGIGITKEVGGFTNDTLYDGICFYRGDKKGWKPERLPDIIILEIGANDSSASEAEYKDKLLSFMQRLRKKVGDDIPFVWAGKNQRNHMVVQSIISSGKIPNLYAVMHDYGGKGSAALATQTAGHPDAAGQEGFADAIIKCMKDNGLIQ